MLFGLYPASKGAFVYPIITKENINIGPGRSESHMDYKISGALKDHCAYLCQCILTFYPAVIKMEIPYREAEAGVAGGPRACGR